MSRISSAGGGPGPLEWRLMDTVSYTLSDDETYYPPEAKRDILVVPNGEVTGYFDSIQLNNRSASDYRMVTDGNTDTALDSFAFSRVLNQYGGVRLRYQGNAWLTNVTMPAYSAAESGLYDGSGVALIDEIRFFSGGQTDGDFEADIYTREL